MSIPNKHHFLPEFYLSRWTGGPGKGRVYGYSRPRASVTVKPYAPSAVGFERDLYSIHGRNDPALKQEVESGFMSPLDSRASEALAFMEAEGKRPDDPKLRDGWTRFVMSLLYRSPERVAWLRRKINDGDAGTLKALSESYSALRVDGDPPTFEDYRTKMGSSLVDEAEALLIRKMIDNEWIGTHLNGMSWSVVRLPAPRYGLLTSDSPLMISNGVGIPDGFLILPLGPDTYFLAANRLQVAQSFTGQPVRALENAFNDAVVKQAEKWVIGATPGQLTFVERRLARIGTPRRSDVLHANTWKAPL